MSNEEETVQRVLNEPVTGCPVLYQGGLGIIVCLLHLRGPERGSMWAKRSLVLCMCIFVIFAPCGRPAPGEVPGRLVIYGIEIVCSPAANPCLSNSLTRESENRSDRLDDASTWVEDGIAAESADT
jgi:hypothetical protein